MYIDYVVDVSSINEYLYCTRRAYYSIFYGDRDINYYLTDGKIKHKNRSKDSKMYNEFFLESRHLGLRGKIDILDYRHTIVPVESKRGVKYYENDEMQLAAYCMLLNDCFGLNVEFGYIYPAICHCCWR